MSAAFTLPPLANDRFLRACLRLPTDATPVWLMRQAGRYLPEYRATRDVAGSFMGLATNPELACEVTMQPLRRYDLDAAILFSDILTVPDAMGLGLSFAAGEGPKFAKVVRDEAAVAELAVPDMDKLRYVFDAVRTIRRELSDANGVGKVPLIGFSGSPRTLACYLIEAGAQAAMVFDSWGGVLADGAFQQFSLAYTKRVLSKLKKEHDGFRIPHIVFTKGGGIWLDEIADSGCDVVGLDWTMNLGKARQITGDRVALQGNLDPNVLFASPEQVRAEVIKTLDSFGKPSAGSGHVFTLGHGISQFTPPDNVKVLVDTVHEHSRKLRG